MNRLAVFVEGYTELLFVERLIEEIAGDKVLIEQRQISGGSKARRRVMTLKASKTATGQRYYVLLVDCGNDDQVKTRIREEHENLTKAGYSKIIGLRDVRPTFTAADIPRLERTLPTYLKTKLSPVEFILAVMEIEAWFLAEHTHFSRIDPAITPASIKASLGFDPQHEDMSKRPVPSADINACYALAGKSYAKPARDTVAAIDYASVYLELPGKIAYLLRLIGSIETFLA